MHPLDVLTAQVSPDVLHLIDQGGSKAVIAVLVIVVAYLARENSRLHEALHTRDAGHTEKLTVLLQAHAVAIATVMEERIDEMEEITKSVTALDSAVKAIESMTRGRRS